MQEPNLVLSKYIDATTRNFNLNIDRAKSSKTTLVWFVGISGFVLTNSKDYWIDVLGTKFFAQQPLNYILLLLPFLVAVLVSFRAYFAIEYWMGLFGQFYKNYVAALGIHETRGGPPVPAVLDLISIDTIDNDKLDELIRKGKAENGLQNNIITDLATLKKCSLKSLHGAGTLERIATWVFFLSIIWTFAFPIIFLLAKEG